MMDLETDTSEQALGRASTIGGGFQIRNEFQSSRLNIVIPKPVPELQQPLFILLLRLHSVTINVSYNQLKISQAFNRLSLIL